MQACCDVAFKYAHERKQFDTRIGEFQLIQVNIFFKKCNFIKQNEQIDLFILTDIEIFL